MENRELHPNLQAALQLVEGIFQMLGSRYEVILHDLSHVESSIVALAGDVTHRKIGGPVTNYLLQLLQKYGARRWSISPCGCRTTPWCTTTPT